MQNSWFKIFIAVVFEVLWVIGLKHSQNLWEALLTLVAIVLSFYFLITATKELPVGTAYAVFVGLGTVGTVLCGILFFGESFKWTKMILIILLIAGVVGLKLATSSEAQPKGVSK